MSEQFKPYNLDQAQSADAKALVGKDEAAKMSASAEAPANKEAKIGSEEEGKQTKYPEKPEKNKGLVEFFKGRASDLVYSPNEQEWKEIEASGNFLLSKNRTIREIKRSFYSEGYKDFYESIYDQETKRDLPLIENIIKEISRTNNFAEALKGKRIIEICAGDSLAGFINFKDHYDFNQYQLQPFISRALAKYIKENDIQAKIMASDVCLQPVIEGRFNLEAVKVRNEDLHHIFEKEEDKFDIVILRDWTPKYGAIPIYKPNGIFICLYPEGQDGPDFNKLKKDGFESLRYGEEYVYVFCAPAKYELDEESWQIDQARKTLLRSAEKGFYPPTVSVIRPENLRKKTSDTGGVNSSDIFLMADEKKQVLATDKDLDVVFLWLREGNFPIDENGNLFFPSEKIPFISRFMHLGNPGMESKKQSLWRFDLLGGRLAKKLQSITRVEFPNKIESDSKYDWDSGHYSKSFTIIKFRNK